MAIYETLEQEPSITSYVNSTPVSIDSSSVQRFQFLSGSTDLTASKYYDSLRINYYDRNKRLQPNIKYICIAGPDEIGTYNGTFRNINLKLKSDGDDNAIDIQKSGPVNVTMSIDEYNIKPLVPTLDTKTAIEVIDRNMVNLESLKSQFNKAIELQSIISLKISI